MTSPVARAFSDARAAQTGWAATPVRGRLGVVRRLRHLIEERVDDLVAAVGTRPGRTDADTIAAEIVPLADACRFLEDSASRMLRPRQLGSRGRPLWLFGADAEVRREPFGVVLVIGPGNYPLLLPGVQALQALVAGNAAVIKPAEGARRPMAVLAELLVEAGLDPALCAILSESVADAESAIGQRPDKVLLTGSADTGRAVLSQLAGSLIPSAMELSGNDAVFVLPEADLDMVAAALSYGLRLNAGATCIAPRRVFVLRDMAPALEARLRDRLADDDPVRIPESTAVKARASLRASLDAGARLVSGALEDGPFMRPTVVADVTPDMDLARRDIFAPVLSLLVAESTDDALRQASQCPYALGASIFGPAAAARALAGKVRAGSVMINDIVVPTADPRLPFGGLQDSGFGVTRGAEGLLALTAIKVVSVRRGRFRPHFDALIPAHAELFKAYLRLAHGRGLARRLGGLLSLLRKGRALRQSPARISSEEIETHG